MSKDEGSGSEQGKPEAKAASDYLVFDMNQRGEKGRPHEVITKMYPKDPNGFQPEPETITYLLYSAAGCPMPMDHAMKFLRDPQFKVVSPKGHRIMPVPVEDHTKPVTKLGEDQLVANYNELSKEALFRRVKIVPGSEDITDRSTVAEMAEFMVAWRKRLRGMTQKDQQLAEMMSGGQLDGGLTEGELEKMFPRRQAA